ncbi:MAG: hypothetical protein HY754_05925 [Nitrospirae bacterium]|nr:hypothetical protein [Nitrospirota bacterium]
MPNVHLLNKRVVGIIVVIVLCSLAYAYTLNSPFHFDDDFYIIDNPIIKNLRFFIEPSTAERFKSNYGYHTFKMRYIASLTFALNYKLHGLGVTGYHIFNLAIHILNAILVYWLVALTLTIHDTRFTIHDKGNTPLVPPVLRGELKGGIVHHASWIVHHHLDSSVSYRS